MDNNQEKREYDSLSEMLKSNKERKREVDSDSYQNYSDDYHDIDDFEDNDVKRYETSEKSDFSQTDMHDIELEDEYQEPRKPSKKNSYSKSKSAEAEKQLKKHKQRLKTVLGVFLGIILSAGVLFVGIKFGNRLYTAVMDYAGMDNSEFQVQVEIPENPTDDQVIEVLEANGIIKDKDFFKTYLERKKEKDENGEIEFVGGEFTLSSAMNYSRIISTLTASKTQKITVDVTIIEGMTASEIGELLEKNYVCKASDFTKYYREKINTYDFERRVLPNKLKFNQLEGYLFPDKYEFFVCNALKEDPKADIDTSEEAETAAKKMYSNFNSKISKQMYKQMNEMGLTLDELISLASMVQSEVGNVDDMRKVASVFLNRLHNSEEYPQLQSDVTVFYVQENIEPYYKDSGLKTSLSDISNAYDTYVCEGIPAGPICNPGMDAINAVLNPETTDYYYFCSNEETGETYYAQTHEEFQECLKLAGLA